jgi:hypothetical protein
MHPLGGIRKTYGINLTRAIETFAMLVLLAVFLIFLVLNVAKSGLLRDGPLIAIFCFACTVPFFPLYYLRVKRRVPRFTVYDQGIGVSLNDDETSWRWQELTTFVAPDQQTLLGAVTLQMGYVSCDFYAGSTKAFRVDRWTARPYELIHYVVMKMTEHTLAKPSIEIYERGEQLDFSIFNLSKQGIITSRETIPWAEIQSVEVPEQKWNPPPQMFVWIQRGGYKSNMGEVIHSAAYLLMAVIDHIMKTDHLKTAQEERLQRQPLMKNQRLRYAAGVGFIVVLYFIIDRFFPGIKQVLDGLR